MTESKTINEDKTHVVNVGVVVSVPVETDATTDEQFMREMLDNSDITNSIAHLIGGALCLRDEVPGAKEWPVKFSRFVVFVKDDSEIKGVADGLWSELK